MMDLTDFIEHTEGLNVQGILVTVNGQEVARYLPEKDEARNIYSGTKSFTSAAVGLAVAEGMFALDDYVGDCFAAVYGGKGLGEIRAEAEGGQETGNQFYV